MAKARDGTDLLMPGGEEHRLRGRLQAAVVVAVGQAIAGVGENPLATDDLGQLVDL